MGQSKEDTASYKDKSDRSLPGSETTDGLGESTSGLFVSEGEVSVPAAVTVFSRSVRLVSFTDAGLPLLEDEQKTTSGFFSTKFLYQSWRQWAPRDTWPQFELYL